jgi:hypothetical protein
MATLRDLPNHLRDHAKAMPDGLLDTLHPAEAVHRLQAVHEMTESADRIGSPEIHRHVLSHAKRLRDAMSYQDFTAERQKLRDLGDSAPYGEMKEAYRTALRDHEDKHEQVSGVGEAIMAHEKANPVSKAAARAAALQKVIDREVAKATAGYWAEVARIRQEIADF